MGDVCGISSSSATYSPCGGDDDERSSVVDKRDEYARAGERQSAFIQSDVYAHDSNGGDVCRVVRVVDAGSCGGGPALNQSPSFDNRTVVQQYASRLADLRADATNGSPIEKQWLEGLAPLLREAQRRFGVEDRAAAESLAKINAVVRPSGTPTDVRGLTLEIFRLKSEGRTAQEPSLRGAITARVTELQRLWCGAASDAGLKAPTGLLSVRASDAETDNSLLWLEAGGVIPSSALATGESAYRAQLYDFAALRDPTTARAAIATHEGNPGVQMQLLRVQLLRLGDSRGCVTGDTVLSLEQRVNEALARRDSAARTRADADEGANARMDCIGVDGQRGMAEELARYELRERILAINPGTTTGSILASVAAARGGSLDDVRRAGESGNLLEGLGGGLAVVTEAKQREMPQVVGPMQNGLSLEENAGTYADLIKSNKPWKWKRHFPGAATLSPTQLQAVRQEAVRRGFLPQVPMKPGTSFPDFSAAGLVEKIDVLPQGLWKASDAQQFRWLDSRLPGGVRPAGMTWHHSEIPGRTELVPFGVHNMVNHVGGRAPRQWAAGSR